MRQQETADDLSVRKTITVNAPQATAFRVFGEDIASWWPLDEYTIGGQPAVTAVLEPRQGGRWYEQSADGTQCDWGRVVTWEPPERLVVTWEISADWAPDSTITSEIDVRFIAEGPTTTRVELEHRNLATFGDRAETMRAIFDSDDGWTGLLARYAARAHV
ncbi:MAG TPA: SRPBCC family protein [Kofleriaceae bacterium]